MEIPVAKFVIDYSHFHNGCDNCGKILSQVRQTVPAPCPTCGRAHFCGPACFIIQYQALHRTQCKINLDNEIDPAGAEILSCSQALWDLRRYTGRWRDELGDAAIAAFNLHSDSSNIDKLAFVANLSYIPHQYRPMQRFQLHNAQARPLATLVGPSMDTAKRKREENSISNLRSGMIGCALIVLACNVPHVGYVFNSTFIGPEPDVLLCPPPPDWEARLLATIRKGNGSVRN